MDAIFLQILNGLDKGSAYALIALGLTLIFGTLGVVNFAHGALFMMGAFCAVFISDVLGDLGEIGPEGDLINFSKTIIDETKTDFLGKPLQVDIPYMVVWFGESAGNTIIDWAVPIAILVTIPFMVLVGVAIERGLIKHFYNRPHADQILVTFGLAIVVGELVKYGFDASEIQTPEPDALKGVMNLGAPIGMELDYPIWRVVYFCFALIVIVGVFAFLQFTTFGMVVRAGMADRETVGMLGINIDKRFTIMFGIAAAVAGLAGLMYAPIKPPSYLLGMEFLVISFVVVVVGGMGSLPGAVLAGFMLGILESFASTTWATTTLPGINQVIIYLVAIIVLLVRPRGLMGRKGVMEE